MKVHHRRHPRAGLAAAGAITAAAALLLAAATYPTHASAVDETRHWAALLDAEGWDALIALCARHRIAALVAHGLTAAGVAPPADSAFIWERLAAPAAEPTSVAVLIDDVRTAFDVGEADLARDMIAVVESLAAADLVSVRAARDA